MWHLRRLIRHVNALGWGRCLRIDLPREERAKGEVLDNRELGQHLGVEHLDHALVDLAPAVADARNVEQDRTVLPERTLLDIVDEADGREVHVDLSLVLYHGGLCDIAGLRGALD